MGACFGILQPVDGDLDVISQSSDTAEE